MARKRRRNSKQSNKLTYYIIGAAVLILIIFAFPNVGKFTDAEEAQWEGNLTIPGESGLGEIPVRYVKYAGSFAVTNQPSNYLSLPSGTKRIGNIYFNHQVLKEIVKRDAYSDPPYQRTPSDYGYQPYVARVYHNTKNHIQGPSSNLRDMIGSAGNHYSTGQKPNRILVPGGYWIDYTGEARIDGKTPAEIEAVKAAAKAEVERKAAEEKAEVERKAAEEKAEEERKAAEKQAKQELEKKKQEAQKFLDEWEEIYFRYGVYETESKELRAVTYNRDNQQIIAVTNAPNSLDVSQQNFDSRYIKYSQAALPYMETRYAGGDPRYYSNLKATIQLIIVSKKVPRATTSYYWVDETGEVYDILEVHFAENQEDIKSQEDQGEPEMESLA
jgi:hypothetical protein